MQRADLMPNMTHPPEVGIGHVMLPVGDVEASSRFYAELGLQLCHSAGDLAILELRGGTHLLLMKRKEDQKGGVSQSRRERVDLMISGRTKPELESYRAALVEQGMNPSAIPDESLYGHYLFRLQDPDGHEVIVATSHSTMQGGS
jgi:catechol 2,3-dioxygenase-like lactoylglutathione lyase family enzyme